MSVAIYPGSFDPMTNGHLSIIRSGLVCFDRLIVAVLRNPRKDALFTVEERVDMIREELASSATAPTTTATASPTRPAPA